jgi:hypothetical protein
MNKMHRTLPSLFADMTIAKLFIISLSRFASFPPPHLSIAQASLALRSVRRRLLSLFHYFI